MSYIDNLPSNNKKNKQSDNNYIKNLPSFNTQPQQDNRPMSARIAQEIYSGGATTETPNLFKAQYAAKKAEKTPEVKAMPTYLAPVGGFADTATLGLGKRLLPKEAMVFDEKTQAEHPIAYGAGQVAGIIPATIGGEGAAGAVFKGTTLLPKLLRGSTAFGGISGVQSAIAGNDLKTIAKDTAIGAALGAGGELAAAGIGKGIKVLKGAKQLPKAVETTKLPTLSPKTIDKKLTPTNLPKVNEITPNQAAINKIKLKLQTEIELPDTTARIMSSKVKEPFNIKKAANNLYTKLVNTNKPIELSKEAKIKASNAKQVGGTVDYVLKDNLVNREGQVIGQSLKNIAEQIPKEKEIEFWDYMLHNHNINRAALEKPVYSDYSSKASAQRVTNYLKNNPEFKQIGDNITKWLNDFMDEWAVKGGLISKESFENMKEMYPNYIPTYRILEEINRISPKKGYVNQTNLIKSAKGDRKTPLPVTNPLESIAQMVNKTVRSSRYNEVGQELLNLARHGGFEDKLEVISSKLGLIDDINNTLQNEGIEGILEKFNNQYDDIFGVKKANGDNIVSVMENGQQVQLKIKDKSLLEAITKLGEGNGDSVAEQVETWFRKVSNPYKGLITSYNPFFAVKNIFRDIPTAYINGIENNPVKFFINYTKSIKEILSDSASFNEFKALGGMRSNFFKNDVVRTKELLMEPQTKIRKMLSSVELFNNLTEAAPRYAEYLATLEKGGTKSEAIYNAAEITVNFSRSGKYTKTADAFFPYLNPAVQGVDKTVRQLFKSPSSFVKTITKGGIIVVAPALILDQVNKNNSNYQALDQRTKDDFYLIPMKNGTFIKIPKTREFGVLLGVLSERIAHKLRGEENSFKDYPNSLKRNFAFQTRTLLAPINDLSKNKDWADRPIVPLGMQMDNRSPKLQYDETTSEIGKILGEKLNLSPKQIDYIISSYSGVIGQILLPSTTKTKEPLQVIKRQFTADPAYSSKDTNDFYNNLNKLKTIATDKNILENIPSKAVTNEEHLRNDMNKISEEMSKIRKKIKSTDDETQKRMLQLQIIELAKKGNMKYNSLK